MLQCCYGNNRKDYDCELGVLRSAILEPESNENTEYVSFFVSGSVMLWTAQLTRLAYFCCISNSKAFTL